MYICHFQGRILTCDLAFAHLHGYHHPEELKGVFVKELIPSLQIPLRSHALPKVSTLLNCSAQLRKTLLPRPFSSMCCSDILVAWIKRKLYPFLNVSVVHFFSICFQMLRVQRVCGRSREGAAVPLCVKLQGVVQCGKPQHQLNGTGYIHLNDSLEMSSSSGSWLKL